MTSQRFRNLMTQTVEVIGQTRNQFGDLTDVSRGDYRCFVQYGRFRAVTRTGEDVTAEAVIFFEPEAPIDEEDDLLKFIHNGRNLHMNKILPIADPRSGALHHYEIEVI